MGSKGHFWISFAKSIVRMLGCGFAMRNGDIKILAVAFWVAEILGMGEEIVDKR